MAETLNTPPKAPPSIYPHLVETQQGHSRDTPFLVYDIQGEDGESKGDLKLSYDPGLKEAYVSGVWINDWRQGTGTAVYKQLPFQALPNGETLTEAGYNIRSSYHQTPAGQALWRSLKRNGFARKQDDGSYVLMVTDVEPTQPEEK